MGYKYSGSDNLDEVAWHYGNSNRKTHPVGTKKPNELGIYDMSGNVLEWCKDWQREYTGQSQVNPEGPQTSNNARVIRGGDGTCQSIWHRVSYRRAHQPDYPGEPPDLFFQGFRLVLP
jgi:formylglycine-generating enzyme required for sulfatase activity